MAGINRVPNRTHEYDGHHDGIKLLALAVLEKAANDYRGFVWQHDVRRRKKIVVSDRWKQSAFNFLLGKTRGPGNHKTCFEFVCMLGNVDPDVIREGILK